MAQVRARLDLDVIERIANSPQRDIGFTRQFYSYPAKFQYRLPAYLVEAHSTEGDIIVDPYCGGGTTLLESGLQGRRSVGYDLNPFAVLISKVKTTRIDRASLQASSEVIRRAQVTLSPAALFDPDDIDCLGIDVAIDIATIAEAVRNLADESHRRFFGLALIHTVKIVGRRDYDNANLSDRHTLDLFDGLAPARVVFSMFFKKVADMVAQLTTLPNGFVEPAIFNVSNHCMEYVRDGSASLIVTSPPYKDLDVEYGILQIQRPSRNRSKRTQFIARFLSDENFPEKAALCGERGSAYWQNVAPTLREARRVLRERCYAFFWTGFKSDEDRDRFLSECESAAMFPINVLPVCLGNDRVASSRSTHHERDTGMMGRDYLIVTEAK